MKKHEFRSLAVAAMAMALAVAVAWIAQPGCSDAKAPADNGRNAAKPTADAAARAEFLKQHQLTGRVTLIQFGTVTCELSDKGLREMALLHKLKAIPGLEFLRVEASKDDEAVKAYYETQSLKFPMHRAPQGLLGRTFDATVYPTFVLGGKFAHVRYRGKQPDNRLAEGVQGLLAERADPGHDVALLGTVKLDGAKLLAQTALPDLGGKRRRLQDLVGPGGMLAVEAGDGQASGIVDIFENRGYENIVSRED